MVLGPLGVVLGPLEAVLGPLGSLWGASWDGLERLLAGMMVPWRARLRKVDFSLVL